MRRWLSLVLLISAPAFAQTYDLRDGDERFASGALEARLTGQTVTFYDDGQSKYFVDGRYTYTYGNDGGTAHGYWEIAQDGSVCVNFVNGFSRCDLFVMRNGGLVLLDEKGDRYPVRP